MTSLKKMCVNRTEQHNVLDFEDITSAVTRLIQKCNGHIYNIVMHDCIDVYIHNTVISLLYNLLSEIKSSHVLSGTYKSHHQN